MWALVIGGFAVVADFRTAQWIAVAYLGVLGSAAIFCLWVRALSHTRSTPTAVSITVNPIFAALAGALLVGEPIGFNPVAGLAAVFVGILLAASDMRPTGGQGAK